MNAERLLAATQRVRASFERLGLLRGLTVLRDQLQNYINNPAQPQHQQAYTNQYTEILSHLDEYDREVSGLSIEAKKLLSGIDASLFLPGSLSSEIRRIFAGNQITPLLAHEKLNEIVVRVDAQLQAFISLATGMSVLGIDGDELQPGEFEIEIVMPREAIRQEFLSFGKEVQRLDRMIRPFSELATGSRPPLVLRSISSSDYSLSVLLAPSTAELVWGAIKQVSDLILTLVSIRLAMRSLQDEKVPKPVLKGLHEHIEERIEAGLSDIKKELLKRVKRRELDHELSVALEDLFERLDNHYRFDVRHGPNPASEDSDDEQASQNIAAVSKIDAIAAELKPLPLDHEPIKRIPQFSSEDENELLDKPSGATAD